MSRLNVALFIILAIMAMNSPCVNARPKTYVHIINGLVAKYVLNIHCYSRDDDLGHHTLPVSGHLDWSFGTSIFGNTVFKCDMNWAGGHGVFKVFWEDEQLQRKCHFNNCIWLAAIDGLYVKDLRINRFVFMYPWQKYLIKLPK
ncbi:S-protein homolog 1 [Ricinus communis]|uniref:S-protein homolog 1 n=1 Tax=Ricinus communis TaxID=3988 RepID=UPI00201AA4D6|nr:S-protein homolog 1 [Ricinus communis]